MSTEPSQALRQLLQTPIDPILADPNRLRAIAALVGLPSGGYLSFTTLRKLLDMTDGNLGQHLRVLVETGYVDLDRVSQGRRTQSRYWATADGRAAFERHSAALMAIVEAARRAERRD
jgi:DNA-binding transcriptional ArsR family regulator